MWSSRTSQLYDLYNKSRKEDFNAWLPVTIQKHVQNFIKPKIKYVAFDLTSEYNDDGGYYDTIECVNFYDESRTYIDLDDENLLLPQHQKGGLEENNLPAFEELVWDVFGDICYEIKDFNLDREMIEVTL